MCLKIEQTIDKQPVISLVFYVLGGKRRNIFVEKQFLCKLVWLLNLAQTYFSVQIKISQEKRVFKKNIFKSIFMFHMCVKKENL